MKPNLSELFERFNNAQRYMGRLADSTLLGYRQAFDLFMDVMPGTTANQLNQDTMAEFFRRLDTRKRIVGRGIEKIGIKSSTVVTYWSKLNKFFQWLRYEKVISADPFQGIPRPDVQYEDRKFLRQEQVDKIIAAVAFNVPWVNEYARKRNIAVVMMFLYTGMRKGELTQLKLVNVDLERRELTVPAGISKSKIQRVVTIHISLVPILKEYMEIRRKTGFTNPYLFTASIKDQRFTKEGLKNLIEQVSKRSGVKFSAHQFRHTYAVNMLNIGMNIAVLRQLMGHRDIRMTASYLRALPTSVMRGQVDQLSLDNMA